MLCVLLGSLIVLLWDPGSGGSCAAQRLGPVAGALWGCWPFAGLACCSLPTLSQLPLSTGWETCCRAGRCKRSSWALLPAHAFYSRVPPSLAAVLTCRRPHLPPSSFAALTVSLSRSLAALHWVGDARGLELWAVELEQLLNKGGRLCRGQEGAGQGQGQGKQGSGWGLLRGRAGRARRGQGWGGDVR